MFILISASPQRRQTRVQLQTAIAAPSPPRSRAARPAAGVAAAAEVGNWTVAAVAEAGAVGDGGAIAAVTSAKASGEPIAAAAKDAGAGSGAFIAVTDAGVGGGAAAATDGG